LNFFSPRKLFRAFTFSEERKGCTPPVTDQAGHEDHEDERKREKKMTSPSGLFMRACRLVHGLRKIRS